MSGAEAILVLGVISSIISIVDGIKQVYDAATDAQGLPKAFREVAARLPIVENILSAAKQHIEEGRVNEDSCKGVKPTIDACEKRARELDELFRKVIAVDGATDLKRYYKAVRAYGKGNEVEKLMKGILEDVQLLSCEHGMKTATKAQQEQIVQAITEVGLSMPRSSDIKAVTSQSLPCAAPSFFGREDELKTIEDCLLGEDPGQKVVVLTGISGLGKTQIALQFWDTHATSYKSRLWIDATSFATVLSSFREIARAMGENVVLENNDTASKQIITAVKAWLELADNTEWLLVIDNVEDLDNDYSLNDIIPKCDHGSILVTSTQSETASVLGAVNIEVGTIGIDAGGAILRRRFKRKTYTDEEKKLTDKVIEALYGVPLAIEQAGAYLHFNPSLTPRVLKSFLEKLSSPITEADVLAKIPGRSKWFYDKHRSVIDTFSLLKTSLVRNNRDALNILFISAFLAQGEIPLLFLTAPVTSGSISSAMARMRAIYREPQGSPSKALTWLRRITVDESAYYMALETLEQFCCIRRRLATHESTYISYSMHNVIRHWCQITLDSEEQAEWTILAAFQLSQHLLVDNVSAFSHQNYFRHMDLVSRVILDPKYESLVRFPNGAYWWHCFATASVLARFYQRQRRFDLVRRMIETIILYEKEVYDSQWPSQRESLETLHLQATILWEEGDFENAIQCYRELLQACEIHLGHFDDLTATASQELRNVQDRSKRYHQAWQEASCAWDLGCQPQPEEEDISSDREGIGLQRFLQRYTDPTIAALTLHAAASSGHEDELLLLLEKGVEIEAKGLNGQTALHEAAEYGHLGVVQLLLEKGAYINAKTTYEETPLFAPVQFGHLAIVQLLLEKGADVEWKRNDGATALHVAAHNDHSGIVQLLLEKGADVEAKDKSECTPLLIASNYGHLDIVQLLLEKGADVESKRNDGATALHMTTQKGQLGIAQLLLEKGADVEAKDESEWTPLLIASSYGHLNIVQLLLEKGADVESKNSNGVTALYVAAQNGHSDIVQLLLEKGAYINTKNIYEETPLFMATQNGHLDIVQLLLKKKADVKSKRNDEVTALYVAAQKGYLDIVQLLLEKGADVEAKDKFGCTPLFIATAYGYLATVQLLLEKKADVESKSSNGVTALYVAAQNGHSGIVQLLLEKGADIEAKDENGWTPLLVAVKRGHAAVVRILVQRGADIEAKISNGQTALHIATQDKREDILQLLQKNGANRGWRAKIRGFIAPNQNAAAR